MERFNCLHMTAVNCRILGCFTGESDDGFWRPRVSGVGRFLTINQLSFCPFWVAALSFSGGRFVS
jgi:hypothetical protein